MKELSTQWHELTWSVERSIRYHLRREGFFGVLHRWTSFVGVMSGSAAAAALFKQESDWAIGFSLTVAIFSGLDMALGFAKMEALHADLRRRFLDVLARLQEAPSEDAMVKLNQRRYEIEKDEPPVFRALDLAVHNELMRAKGHKPTDPKYAEHFHHISRWQLLTKHVRKWESLA